MQGTTLEGSYEDIGHQQGTTLSNAGFSPDPLSTEKAAFVERCETIVRRYAPEVVEELHGFADAGHWDFDAIAATPLALGWDAGCSVVAVAGAHTTDRPLFARNYDFYRSYADFSEVYHTAPANRNASVGFSDHWTGRHDGINEHGLAIGHAFVPHDGLEPGIMFALAARVVLDRYTSTEDAVAFLEEIPHARNTNFLIADATGTIAIVEASPDQVRTRFPEDGFGAITNHFQSSAMREFEGVRDPASTSETRLDTLSTWVTESAGAIDVESLQQVCANAEGGVCSRSTDDATDPIETLWSLTARLNPATVHVARGRPDRVEFEHVTL